ncbi:aminopeptidase M1-like isoform X1 [Quercus robur]|uniref:aminopeptidase M1-like isoform X1 n=1 Tax=Quercus robur TaxID=38942 RepID=UPI00216224D6|nr:aminopeptidase M1-like isoform X1 [Quercus robur]
METKTKQSIEQFKGQTRLPKFAIPTSYDLYIKLDLTACTFSGTVQVNLNIIEHTKFLVLNVLELDVHQVWFTNSNHQTYKPCDVVVLDGEDEILVLGFDEVLSVGDGVLGIEFSGSLNPHLKGLYKCTYVDGGVKKNMAVTQFEAVDARRCFPCWDEPALKATFRIRIDVPSELTALSNMPIADERLNENIKTVYFEESPVMSTYLVGVVVGVFDHIEETTADGIKVRVYCPVGKSDKGKFALNLAVKALDIFTRYFSTPYPLPKLDMVAVPEFSGGAMENYGLITYRENILLYDDLLSSANMKQFLTIVVSHEVAHHWFGNLVTMEWWSHLWLNEGFATWISYMATDIIFPEWKIWTQFLRQTADGLRMDAMEQSHPIEVEVHHARSIEEIFDDISYKKGSAVIRMLQGYLGDDMFQKSLSLYIKRYAGKNAKTEDLWCVLSEESGLQINSMMDDWTKKNGYPVISVKSKDDILEFEQSQFLSSGLCGDGLWIVPITVSIGSYIKCKTFLLEKKSQKLDLSELVHSPHQNKSTFNEKNEEKCDEHFWVKVNIEQSGFYRVKYEDKLAARLRKAIESNCLSATDKFGILDDTYALCVACEQPLSSLLSLMDVYRKELDFIVLSKLINVCYKVVEISGDAIPDLVNDLKQFFINLLLFSSEKSGWESIPGESHLNALLRGEVFLALVTFGHDKTNKEAVQRFQALLNDQNTPLLSADTRKAAYIAVLLNTSTTNRNGFESLLKLYREADTVQEKEPLLRCIASCPDPNIVLEALNFMLSEEVRDQDILYVLAGLRSEGREVAWRWLKENWDLIFSKYGAILLHQFITYILTLFCSNEKAEEIEEFFVSRVHPSFTRNLKQSIEEIRLKARWVENIRQEQSLPELVKQLALKK